MTKKEIEKVKKILKESNKPLDQDEISRKIGVNFWNVVRITENLEKQGLITSVK